MLKSCHHVVQDNRQLRSGQFSFQVNGYSSEFHPHAQTWNFLVQPNHMVINTLVAFSLNISYGKHGVQLDFSTKVSCFKKTVSSVVFCLWFLHHPLHIALFLSTFWVSLIYPLNRPVFWKPSPSSTGRTGVERESPVGVGWRANIRACLNSLKPQNGWETQGNREENRAVYSWPCGNQSRHKRTELAVRL